MSWSKVKLGNAELLTNSLPSSLTSDEIFQTIWDLHPEHFNQIEMFEKEVFLPRWQQAYGRDYFFSKQISQALPIPTFLLPFLEWAREHNSNYNGLLLNWYDSDLKHYIGKHRDSEVGLIPNSVILTISLGASRVFRVREIGQKGFEDLEVKNGDVVGLPWKVNKRFTHEVPHLERYSGRRISITIRAFQNVDKSGLDR